MVFLAGVEGMVFFCSTALDKPVFNLLFSRLAMSLIKRSRTSLLLMLFLGVSLWTAIPCAAAQETDETADLFNAWQEQSSSATRAPKPLSQTAENVTVITTQEIESLNAHTLADVLATVTGIQVESMGGPGSVSFVTIQSTNYNHIRVFLDGVPLNNGGNFADVGTVPARIIERIEIIKGTASSSWGQGLGGVINVITKSPDKRPIGGSVSGSMGERMTADAGAELTGTSGRVGYYLSGGYLGSDGLRPVPQRSLYSNYAYGKLTYDLPANGQLWGTINYTCSGRVDNYDPTILDFNEITNQHYLYATLGFRKPLTERLELELDAHYAGRDKDGTSSTLSTRHLDELYRNRERVAGAEAKLVWRGEHHLLVGGFEYEHEDYKFFDAQYPTPSPPTYSFYRRLTDRYSVYLNDTISFGPVTVIPGVRYDNTANKNQFSPSIGATLKLGENNLLRAYAGRGYSYAIKDANWATQKIWTVQVGMESSSIPYLWVKGTLFRNELWNVVDDRNLTSSPERRIALGAEIEARTVPVFHTSLGAGYTFVDTTHDSNGSQVYSFPRHTVQLSLRYDDQTFRGTLTGRHVMWNGVPGYGGSYGGMIWDLHLGATLMKRENSSLEIFFSGHNLFDSDQYPDAIRPNTGRWFEGGVRLRF